MCRYQVTKLQCGHIRKSLDRQCNKPNCGDERFLAEKHSDMVRVCNALRLYKAGRANSPSFKHLLRGLVRDYNSFFIDEDGSQQDVQGALEEVGNDICYEIRARGQPSQTVSGQVYCSA